MLFLALRRDSARWNALVGVRLGPGVLPAAHHLGRLRGRPGAVGRALGPRGGARRRSSAPRGRGPGAASGRGAAPGCRWSSSRSLWVAVEELRSSWPFGGFPWGRLAFSQAESPLGRLAWLGRRAPRLRRRWRRSEPCSAVALVTARRLRVVRSVAATATGVALVLAAVCSCRWTAAREDGTLRLGAVQGSVPTPGLDAFAQQREVLHNHAAGTEALLDQVEPGELDLVVWPENGSDVDPQVDRDAAREIDDAARAVDAPVLVGHDRVPRDRRPVQHRSACGSPATASPRPTASSTPPRSRSTSRCASGSGRSPRPSTWSATT